MSPLVDVNAMRSKLFSSFVHAEFMILSYTIQNKFSNYFVLVSQSTSDLTFLFSSIEHHEKSPCNEHSLTPHFYIIKLGFTGVYIFFFFFALKHRLWVLVRTASLRRF